MNDFLTLTEIYEISNVLEEHGLNEKPITILNEVGSKELLNKLNENFFYQDEKNRGVDVEEIDEIKVSVSKNITFLFKVKKDD